MIRREKQQHLQQALHAMPVVALLGSKQVGKTTLALSITKAFNKKTTYLDLELDSDFNKLTDPEAYLGRFSRQLFSGGR
ncbi:AAA family ATPase [Echinicola soli]|uniref:AAA family ATPase n=1 Tax=Echinicola soli TaxID=2591634 RepID=UPI001AF00F7A|nr:AAA family ATPase [Echinicola soli]